MKNCNRKNKKGLRRLITLLAVAMIALGSLNCASEEPCKVRFLDDTIPWYPGVIDALNQMIVKHGQCSDNYDSDKKPVAVFDNDNTIIKNDIGDGTMFYMLQNDLIKAPSSWGETSKHLSGDAITSLNNNCPLSGSNSVVENGMVKTSTNPACATAILCIYYEGSVWNGTTSNGDTDTHCTGADAWSIDSSGGASDDTIEPAYAWTVSLQAGYTVEEIGNIGMQAFEARIANDIGSTTQVGYVTGLHGYNRVYPQIKDLIAKLQDNGFEVWISTASNEYIVAPISDKYYGIPKEKVIGVRPVIENGLLTVNFEGCGTFSDGQDIINYKQGKRCFLNKVLFNIANSDQLTTESPILFGAGDSTTDIFFLKDAEYRLVIDRHKDELMCNAYNQTEGGNWMITPMMIEPKDKEGGYDCSAYGLPNVAAEDEVDPAIFQ